MFLKIISSLIVVAILGCVNGIELVCQKNWIEDSSRLRLQIYETVRYDMIGVAGLSAAGALEKFIPVYYKMNNLTTLYDSEMQRRAALWNKTTVVRDYKPELDCIRSFKNTMYGQFELYTYAVYKGEDLFNKWRKIWTE
ncbi:hypothetical protein, partial [Salmonella enterica]|uniref:hypothetical protein n=1 Tax=Salmonella enterica TaxID=28901 RepID=UPI0011BDD505